MQLQKQQDSRPPQLTEEDRFIDGVLQRALRSKIITPDDYALENAVKSAYLMILQDGHIGRCTNESIANAMMDMIVQGLNPVKDQCYFIAYGNRLKCMRSYLGSIAVLKRFDPRVSMVNAEPFYEGDQLDYEIVLGVKKNIKHRQKIGNVKRENIVGVYATVIDHDGHEIESEIMVWDEVLRSWEKSQRKIWDSKGGLLPSSDHAKYPARFARRTVINRICKKMISATDDKKLMDSFIRSGEDHSEQDLIQYEIDENANQKLIDFQQQDEPVEVVPSEQASIPVEIKPEVINIDNVEMATEDQIKKLYGMEKANKREDNILENVGSFVNRKLAGLSELTKDEINEYIEMLNEEKKNSGGPDWK